MLTCAEGRRRKGSDRGMLLAASLRRLDRSQGRWDEARGGGEGEEPNLKQHAGDQGREDQAQGHGGPLQRTAISAWGQGKARRGRRVAGRHADGQPASPASHAQRPSPPCAPTHLAPRLPTPTTRKPSPSTLQHCAKHSNYLFGRLLTIHSASHPDAEDRKSWCTQPTHNNTSASYPSSASPVQLYMSHVMRVCRPPQTSVRDGGRRLQSHERKNAYNLLLHIRRQRSPSPPCGWLSGTGSRQAEASGSGKQRQGPDPRIGTAKKGPRRG